MNTGNPQKAPRRLYIIMLALFAAPVLVGAFWHVLTPCGCIRGPQEDTRKSRSPRSLLKPLRGYTLPNEPATPCGPSSHLLEPQKGPFCVLLRCCTITTGTPAKNIIFDILRLTFFVDIVRLTFFAKFVTSF